MSANTVIHTTDSSVKAIALAAFPAYAGRKITVEAFAGPMSLASYWSGGSRDSFAFVNLASRKAMALPQNGTAFDAQSLKLSELPEGAALVRHTIFSGKDCGLTVFVNPANLAAMLPAPSDLTNEERIVLAASQEYTLTYRVDSAKRDTGITRDSWNAAKSTLILKGLLATNGAITSTGKDAIGNTRTSSLAPAGFNPYGVAVAG